MLVSRHGCIYKGSFNCTSHKYSSYTVFYIIYKLQIYHLRYYGYIIIQIWCNIFIIIIKYKRTKKVNK